MPLVRFWLKSWNFVTKNPQTFGGSSTTWTAWSQRTWDKNNLRRPENRDLFNFPSLGQTFDSSTSGALELIFLKENKQWKFAINHIKSFNIKPWTCEIITTIFKNKLWTSRNNNSISNDVNMWRFDGFLGPPGSLSLSNSPWSDEWIPWHPRLRRKKATGGKKPMMRRQWSQKGRRRNFPTISFCGQDTKEFSKKEEFFILEQANCECWCFSGYSWFTKRERL